MRYETETTAGVALVSHVSWLPDTKYAAEGIRSDPEG